MKRINVFMLLSLFFIFVVSGFSTGKNGEAAPVATDPVKIDEKADSAVATAANAQGAVEESAPTPAELKKKADLLSKKGKKGEAFELYKQCIDAAGDDSSFGREALIVAKEFYAEKKYEEALQYFAKVDAKNAKPLSFRTMLGTSLHKTGKNDSAIALLESVASDRKIAVAVRKSMFPVLGDACLALEKKAEAAVWYDKYFRSGGAKTADMAYIVASQTVLSAPAKAPVLLQGNIKSFPSDYRNYVLLGTLYSNDPATFQKAVTLLTKALSMNDSIGDAWFKLGITYQRLQKPDDALDAYKKCIEVDAANLQAKLYCGQLMIDKGMMAEAITCLENAHKQAPDSSAPMMLLANAYTRGGKPDRALEMLETLAQKSPDDIAVKRELYTAYMANGKDQKALEVMNAVLEKERFRETLFPYAKLLAKLGKYDDAVTALEEVLGSMPDDFEALMLLADVFRQQKKYDNAVNVYKEVCSMDPQNGPALFERAEVHLAQDKVKWAEMFYKRALAADPQMGLAEVGLAKVARLFKNDAGVATHLNNARNIAGDDPVVIKAINDFTNPPAKVTEKSAEKTDNPKAVSDSGSKKKKKSRKKK